MRLQFQGRMATGDPTLDTGLSDLDIAAIGDGTYLVSATGGEGGLVVWRLEEGRLASEIDRQYHPGAMATAVSGTVSAIDGAGGLQVLIGGQGGSGLLGYQLGESGFGAFQTGPTLTNGTARISDVVQADSGLIYVADTGSGRLTAYAPDATGPAAPTPDGQVTIGGAASLATLHMGSHEYLLATNMDTNGLDSYRILADGGLRQSDTFGAAQGLGIAAPNAMTTLQAWGESWVLLGSAGSHALSVLRLEAGGGLAAADLVLDTLETRFGGVTDIAAVEHEGRVFVLAGGADDGLTLFTLLPDGRLVHLQSLAHTQGAGLMNVGEISLAVVGGDLQVFVAGSAEAGISQFTIPLADLGLTATETAPGARTLSGSAGDDLLVASGGDDTLVGGLGDDILAGGADGGTLSGGAGADRFVIDGAAARTAITDFTPGQDSLDLSDFAMLRDPAQLTVTPMADGARVVWRDSVIVLRSADGDALSADDLFGARFDGPDRIPILTPEPPDSDEPDDPDDPGDPGGQTGGIAGGSGNDTLEGGGGDDQIWAGPGDDVLTGGGGNDTLGSGAGNDLLEGGGGDDQIWAGPGDDVLGGGGGNDTANGGDGHDMLRGGDGNDSLSGGTGDDTLLGGSGHDILWASDGDDSINGGAQGDTLAGGNGNDTLIGDHGWDQIWGGNGEDQLSGGDGRDQLNGLFGDDTLDGGADNDVLWGGQNDDRLIGGAGDDVLGGFTGHDTMQGDGGNDALWCHFGNDLAAGGDGNDTLAGADGADSLYGGNGQDRIIGGTGDDLLSGGAGADRFVFYARGESDRITDFEPGLDQLQILVPGLGYGGLDIRAQGNDTVITLPGGQVVLEDVAPDALGADDFLFS